MKNILSNLLYLFVFLVISISCSDNLDVKNKKTEFQKKSEYISERLQLNKKKYVIKKGQKFKIYYTNNSCCLFCSPRLKELKNSKFLYKKAETNSKGCEGCTDLYSLNFIGIKEGVDTIYATTLTPKKNCETFTKFTEKEKYIIIIK